MDEENKHHVKTIKPAFQTGDEAIVLGARPGNIGGEISKRLSQGGWIIHEDDCARGEMSYARYFPPPMTAMKNCDACVITLGVTHMEPFAEVREPELRKVLYGSLELPLECARRYVQDRLSMKAGGKLVFIGSYAYDHPFTHCTSYCVAKAGLDMAARSLAWELKPEGFDVHIIHPHHVQDTPMTQTVREGMMHGHLKLSEAEAEQYSRKDLRMPDLLKPEEIAELVHWLLTDKIAPWLTGNGLRMYGSVR